MASAQEMMIGGCNRAVCARPRAGDCTGAGRKPCLMPHAYPPPEFPLQELIEAFQTASDRVTASLMQTSLSERDATLELRQEGLESLERRGWRPDFRVVAGLGLGAVGGYLLWKYGKKRR